MSVPKTCDCCRHWKREECTKSGLMSKEHPDKNLLGIGLAFPGLLNVKEGMVKRSINLGPEWSGFPIQQALEKELNLPVFIENNSNASVLAERWFGAGTNCKLSILLDSVG